MNKGKKPESKWHKVKTTTEKSGPGRGWWPGGGKERCTAIRHPSITKGREERRTEKGDDET